MSGSAQPNVCMDPNFLSQTKWQNVMVGQRLNADCHNLKMSLCTSPSCMQDQRARSGYLRLDHNFKLLFVQLFHPMACTLPLTSQFNFIVNFPSQF